MQPHPDPAVQAAAEEIEAYLAANRRAAETLQGLVEWWVFRRRFEEAWRTVETAVRHLVSQGRLEANPLPGGDVLYSSKQGEA